MTGRSPAPSLVQVAFSVLDLAATERWFREGLGFWPAGGSRRMMRGPLASSVQGLPHVASTCWWMVDRNEFFQLEMFQFERPSARLMPHDARPCDIGYARIGVWAADFDETLTRLARLGSRPLSDPIGPAGERRACVRNPDGVYVEIMENDPLAWRTRRRHARPVRSPALGHAVGAGPRPLRGVLPPRARPPALRCRPASSPSMKRSGAWRAPALRAVCWTPAASSSSWCSTSIRSGGRARRARRSRIRASSTSPSALDTGAITASSTTGRPQPERDRTAGRSTRPGRGVVYVNDTDDFSVELLWMSRGMRRDWGFTPRPAAERPRADTHAIERTVRIAAPAQATWDVIADHRTHVGLDRPRLRPADRRRRTGS